LRSTATKGQTDRRADRHNIRARRSALKAHEGYISSGMCTCADATQTSATIRIMFGGYVCQVGTFLGFPFVQYGHVGIDRQTDRQTGGQTDI